MARKSHKLRNHFDDDYDNDDDFGKGRKKSSKRSEFHRQHKRHQSHQPQTDSAY